MKNIVKWLFVLALVAVIVYTFRDSAAPIMAELKGTAPLAIFGICALSMAYLVVEAWITEILSKQYNPDFKYRHGMGNAIFCSFYRVATLGSGAGVAALVYLNEHGVEYSKGFGMYMLQYAFHKISTVIFSAIFFLISFTYMCSHFGDYIGLLLVGYAVTLLITVGLIMFCCSTGFHRWIFKMLDFFNKKGKYDVLRVQLRQQCDELEEAASFLLKKKKMVWGVIGLNLIKFAFWYGIPFIIFAGSGQISLVHTMSITALAVMLAGVLPAPAGIGSTELVFALLFTPIVGTGLAGSASLLYRFATFVFPFVLGMFMVIGRRIRGAYASRNL